MRGLIDCHVHTRLCGHATGSVSDCAAVARKRGLAGIAITEHLPLPAELDPDRTLSMATDMVDAYLSEIEDARYEFPELEMIAGIEADWLPDRVGDTRAAIGGLRRRSDGVRVVLGSVHFLSDWAFDDPNRVHEWEGRDVDAVWDRYVTEWCAAAESGLFDVMAHPDLPKKFGHRPSKDVDGLNARFAESAARANLVIEVSTAGLRKPVGELYPSAGLLRAFRAAGVRATLGSDAHQPEEVGYAFSQACGTLRSVGYEELHFPTAGGQMRSVQL